MTLYLFEAQPLCMADSPVETDEGKEFNRHTWASPVRIRLRDEAGQHFQADELPDRICIPGTEYLAISDRLSQLLQRFQVCESVTFIPAEIMNQRSDVLSIYRLGMSTKAWNVLHKSKSQYVSYGDLIISVTNWVIDNEMLPELDVFYAYPNDWFVTDRVVDAVTDSAVTGCRLTPVVLSE